MRIGVDAGGTFTDFIAVHDDGRVETFKLRSNPRSPASVILEGLRLIAPKADVVHGSTVATNALLERKGARTAFVTTAGFEDVLEIGRQNRAELYDLTPPPKRVPVDRALRFGVQERTHFDGVIARKPAAEELKRLALKLTRKKVQSVAICFLHSYQNSSNERAAERVLQEQLRDSGVYVCSSHEISPEFREYERSSTTFVNAYVGPLMKRYLSELASARGYRISIMQSNGGFLSAREAAHHAVRTVLSGPAGGAVAAVDMARRSGFQKILGFDMGGTSTDVCLADGAARETTESVIDGLPIRVPMLDIHTVGAGGGSIARVDAGGLLRVGPESAGADPGPACYGAGHEATVTDAHVVLGRISAEQLLGGAMHIDVDRANAAVDRIAKELHLDRIQAAAGIVRVANANMERAIRAVSVERGYDPRDFALVAFGGGGGLHACEIAGELGIPSVIVPAYAGALSALGMILADGVRDYAAGVLGKGGVEKAFAKLQAYAKRESPGADVECTADLRYQGQSYELNVAWNPHDPFAAFHREHQKLYGYATPERAVEIVTVRVRARRRFPKPRLVREKRQAARVETRPVWVNSAWMELRVVPRTSIGERASIGPAVVLDYGSTTLVPEGWSYRVDRVGNLLMTNAR